MGGLEHSVLLVLLQITERLSSEDEREAEFAAFGQQPGDRAIELMAQVLGLVEDHHLGPILVTTTAIIPIQINQRELRDQAREILAGTDELKNVGARKIIGIPSVPTAGLLMSERRGINKRLNLAEHGGGVASLLPRSIVNHRLKQFRQSIEAHFIAVGLDAGLDDSVESAHLLVAQVVNIAEHILDALSGVHGFLRLRGISNEVDLASEGIDWDRFKLDAMLSGFKKLFGGGFELGILEAVGVIDDQGILTSLGQFAEDGLNRVGLTHAGTAEDQQMSVRELIVTKFPVDGPVAAGIIPEENSCGDG